MSDFSLMDAIELRDRFKLPRRAGSGQYFPVGICPNSATSGRNVPQQDAQEGARESQGSGPAQPAGGTANCPGCFIMAIMRKRSQLWQQAQLSTPPCFIIVCQNTPSRSWCMTSFLDPAKNEGRFDGMVQGRLELFRNMMSMAIRWHAPTPS